ncbi:SWIM zinc finger family protein [Haloarchaeobius sp. HRN-SO-5]|uniref:SWIM zinc finger family protein n=1 Tax=Haloarchaeobius sp. HRN-SO-5 TaxID=3446118 RepID=UPI003EBAA32F
MRNCSHADPAAHEYLVRVVDGIPSSCTCPADDRFAGACKHRVAVAIRRPVLGAALAKSVATDGGVAPTDPVETEADDSSDCDCDDLPEGVPCWPCYRRGAKEFDLPVETASRDD